MTFRSLISSSPTKPKSQVRQYAPSAKINNLLVQNFHSTTLLLVGAILQGFLVLAIPRYWTLLPSLIILLVRFADSLAITLRLRPNPYLEGAIKRWATIVPDTDGNFSDQPADEKVAVLLLCIKLNHPLGFFAPNVKAVNDFAEKMIIELDDQALNNGFLGQSQWHSTDAKGASEVMLLSYWRSIDDIHNYAAGPLHTQTTMHWNAMVHKDADGMKHIGISHEVFEAPRGRWEALSIHFQPTRLGATSYLRRGDKLVGGNLEDQWVSPVVEAKGRLRNSKGRLNWADNGNRSSSDSGDEKH